MKKSDLKDGMVVTIRGGQQCILIERNLFKNNFTLNSTLFDYNEDLTHKKNKNNDVVKVFGIGKLKELWERKEIDWNKVPVGTKVMVKLDFDDEYQKAIFLCNNSKHFLTYSTDKGIEHWNYCKLAEEPKEEVTFYDVNKKMDSYCEKNNKSCDQACGPCVTKYILDNYDVTKKVINNENL